MDWLDNVLATAGNTASQVIDAWGRVQVAQYDAQVQPPARAPSAFPDFQSGAQNINLWLIGGAALVAIFLVLKK